MGVETSHGDARITRHVDVTLIDNLGTLLLRQTEEGEHANLLENVIPVTSRSGRLELARQELVKLLAHLDDSVSHLSDVFLPLCPELVVGEDHSHHSSAKGRWVADFAPLNHAELAQYGVALCLCRADNVQRTDSLAIETGILGKALADQDGDRAALDKVPHRVCVLVEISRGKALVCAVEECKVALGLKQVGNGVPLLLGRVDTGRVVGTGVEQEDGAIRCRFERRGETIEVKTDRLGIVLR